MHRIQLRARVGLLATLVLLGSAIAPSAAGQETNEFVPFVTDFPQRGTDPSGEFIPFVTDFPGTSALRPAESGVSRAPQTDGFDWSNTLLGAGTVLSLAVVLLAAVGVPPFRRRMPAPERGDRGSL
jgi:hypothetical protein